MAGSVVHRLVVGHPGTATVLLVRVGEAWRLPEVELEERHTAEVEHLNAAALERWGVTTTVRRALAYEETPAGVRRTHALEAHAIAPRGPSLWRWAGLDELARLGAAAAEIDLARQCLAGGETGDWTSTGWWPEVRSWIEAQVGPAEIAQTRAWESSCVARVRARGEAFFFKAVPNGARETAVTAFLARRRAPAAPDVVAAHSERNWLLMRAFPGSSLDDVRDAALWRRAAEAYGRLQASLLEDSEALRALGCVERRLDDLAAAVEPLLSDVEALMPGHPEGLSSRQVDDVYRLGPELRRSCETLADSGLPLALDHGDLWPSNILLDEAGCVLIDWEDAGLSHPFLGLAPLLAMRGEWQVPLGLDEIAAAYLPPFASLASRSALERVFRAAAPLGLFEMAVRYWRTPAATSALHPWMREMVPFFLRHALDQPEPGARRRSA